MCAGQLNWSGAHLGTSLWWVSSNCLTCLTFHVAALFTVTNANPPSKVLLTAHKAWFVRQRCSDPFAVTLSLNKLLPKPSASTAAAASVLGPSAAGAAGGVGGDRPCSAGRVGAAAAGEAAAGVGGVGAGQGPPQAAAAAAGAAGAAARLAAGAAAAAGGDHPAWEFYGGYGAGVLGGVFAEAMAAGGGAAMAGEGGEEEEEDEEAMRAGDEDDDVPDVDEAAVLQVCYFFVILPRVKRHSLL